MYSKLRAVVGKLKATEEGLFEQQDKKATPTLPPKIKANTKFLFSIFSHENSNTDSAQEPSQHAINKHHKKIHTESSSELHVVNTSKPQAKLIF